jgi:polygalacturonase
MHSSNVTIDGIIVVNPQHYTVFGGESRNITIRNLKSFSTKGWSDGIDLMSCSEVLIDDVFMRNSDDCIAIYAHRWNFYGSARNISITNSILWADIAHPTNIGIHGNTTAVGDTIENVLFKNIDILEHDEDDPNYQGCMAINAGDLNLVRNVLYEDIRVDDFEEGQLLNLRVVYNKQYNTGPGRGIQNIYFKNISYTGANLSPAVIQGLDEKHTVNNIIFENLRINGKLMTDTTSANIRFGPHAAGIQFKK